MQRPGWRIAVGGSCSVVGLRWWAGAPCACVPLVVSCSRFWGLGSLLKYVASKFVALDIWGMSRNTGGYFFLAGISVGCVFGDHVLSGWQLFHNILCMREHQLVVKRD